MIAFIHNNSTLTFDALLILVIGVVVWLGIKRSLPRRRY